MNLDIRIAVSFRNHRKRKRLRLLLGPGSTDYLLDLWIATAMNHPSGILSGMDETDIALEAGWEGEPVQFVEALVQSGFLNRVGDGYCLHDWAEHQAYVVKAPGRKAAAQYAASKRWAERVDAKNMPGACGGHTESMPRAMPLPSPSPLPVPAPVPAPLKEYSSNEEYLSPEVSDDATSEDAEKPKSEPPSCPHQQVIALYREILPTLTAPRTWDGNRAVQLRTRWREAWERLKRDGKPHETQQDVLNWWRSFFGLVKQCPFLMGQVNNRPGQPPFTADLDWLTKKSNFAKVIDGKYLDRRAV